MQIMIFFIVQSIYFGNANCSGRHTSNEGLNFIEQADKVGRDLLQQPCAIEIDECYYASADDECKEDYFPDVKIINSNKADIKQYPFFVSLRKQRTDDCGNNLLKCYQHFCGGSLVLEDVVLTAAHCVVDFIDTTKTGRQAITEVLLVSRESKCRHQGGIEDLLVGWIEIHPNYSSYDVSHSNDIALLYLKGKMEKSDAIINFIDAKKYENIAEQIGNNAGIIGFGDTGLEPDKISLFYSSQLREAWTRVRKYSICLDSLKDYANSQFSWSDILDNQTMICTYNQQAGACDGDSGGPLFIKTDSGKYVLLGIMSWGPSGDCFSTKGAQAPNIFTRVSFYEDFILDSVRKSSDSNIQNLYVATKENMTKNINFNCSDECSCPEALQCDVDALQAFKNSIVGDDSLLTSWVGTNPCKWDYIVCDIIEGNNRRVVQVHLNFKQEPHRYSKFASLVPEFSKLRFIDKLYFANHNIIGRLWEEYSVLEKLAEFNTSHLQLTGTLPSTYSTWTNLQNFQCNNNSIQGKIAKEWSQLANLKNLDISDNKLQGTLLEQFSTWSNLETLSISFNQFMGTLPPTYSTWGKVIKLDVMGNNFSGTLPPQYSAATTIVEFRASGNELSGVLPTQWSTWKSLSIFSINMCFLSGNLPAEYSSMTTIRELSVSSNELNGTLPIEYSTWRLCNKINAAWNTITGTLPPEYSEMFSLKYFNVGYNEITGDLPPEYSEMSRMEDFIVRNNENLVSLLPPEYSTMRFIKSFIAKDIRLFPIIPVEWSVFGPVNYRENDRQFEIINLLYQSPPAYNFYQPTELAQVGWTAEFDELETSEFWL